jgi:hypothetical protein
MIRRTVPSSVFFIIVTLLLLSSLLPANAEKITVEGYAYVLDLPEGWGPIDTTDLAKVSFANPEHTIVFQVYSFPGDKYFKASEIYTDIKSKLKATGDYENFSFMSKNACISELAFSTGKLAVKGYFIFINGDKTDYTLACFTPEEFYKQNLSSIFSSLDSFSLDESGRLFPGPVSQVYYPFPGPEAKPVSIDFNGKKYSILLDQNELDAASMVIEREALLLSTYPAGSEDAAKRLYRIVYRDNYARLTRLFDAISVDYKSGKKTQKDFILDTLSWIQGFPYSRTESPSDLSSPLASAFNKTGDCDSRSLLLVTLLHHFKIDAVLLVSLEFQHAGTGVPKDLVKSEGIYFTFNNKKYLYAETTKKIAIGNIASDMFDQEAWFPVYLPDE